MLVSVVVVYMLLTAPLGASSSFSSFSSGDPQEEVTVAPGEDVTLQCQTPNAASITLLAWSRSDLESDKYVFYYRGHRPVKSFQLPSFHGRVELKDPEMKDGDASVILKNVNIHDAGTYECRIGEGNNTKRRKRDTPEVLNTIHLHVKNSDPQEEVTVTPGEDVTLQCQAPSAASITLLAWNRSDLGSKKYILYLRGKRPVKSFQLPSFHGRVELKDPEMKDGDASVILKKVTVNDTGTYKCWIGEGNDARRRKREAPKVVNIIHLKVENSGQTAGNKDEGNKIADRLIAGLSVFVVLLLLFGGFVIYRQYKRHKRRQNRQST